MKREIKFRVWNTDGKRFEKYLSLCIDDITESLKPKPWFIVDQFTGLKVKGVDLYESDVIEATLPDGVPVRHIISFEDGSFIHQNVKYESLTGRIKQSWLDEIGFEIIGNIHQHEHLLK